MAQALLAGADVLKCVYTLKDITCWENILLHSHPEIEISFKFIPKILMSKECIHFFGPLCIFFSVLYYSRHIYHDMEFMLHLLWVCFGEREAGMKCDSVTEWRYFGFWVPQHTRLGKKLEVQMKEGSVIKTS